MTRAIGYTFLMMLIPFVTMGQKYTISGHVKDRSNGEVLIGANIYIQGTQKGTATNAYGFYSLTVDQETDTLVYTYMGYRTRKIGLNINHDTTINTELKPASKKLQEVVITDKRPNQNVSSVQMSMDKLTSQTISKIPVLMGETDMIKSLQLLPGVKNTGSLSSGMSIRGGGRDQNLMLLDEATVYNASHLGGIFSVFNTDAIKNVELYKGKIPARYGGRLASLIDIRMKDGNMKRFSGEGGIGLISSRLTLESPIVKNKGSVMVSGRRTYMDAVIRAARELSGNENIIEFPFHFYDLNAKANYRINSNNRLYLSGYFGRDVFSWSINKQNQSSFNWGNYTGTLRWNHLFSKKLFSNFTFLASNYDYLLANELTVGKDEKIFSFEYEAFVKDYSFKADFGYYLNQNNTLRFGIKTTHHDFNVGEVEGQQDTVNFSFKMPKVNSIETALYISNQQQIGDRLSLKYGLRYSLFLNIGPARVNQINDRYEVTGQKSYEPGSIYHNYGGLEPRLAMNYTFSPRHSIKASYSRTRQHLLIASNSNSGTPLDVWISANPNIKPQVGDQYSVGYFRNFFDNQLESSLEVYYKDMQHQVAFDEFAQPQFNPEMIEDLRFGRGKAYGLELLFKKPAGRLSGWLSYSYSRSMRKIRDIQEKDWYPSPYDRPHDLTLVAMFDLTPRISLSANWTIKSGRPLNAPAARYEYGNLVLPYYSGRNQDRMPAYHRLDLGVTIQGKQKPNRDYRGKWVFSVYNVYARKNADAIYFTQGRNHYTTKAMRTTYFTIFPSVSYNFSF
ncbi:MAG: TonB-dependent receptor [Bacteroidales bacterium]|nr:TonB-dependent receptor [Bacteroidales bacterium]